MGGARGGTTASGLAVSAVAKAMEPSGPEDDDTSLSDFGHRFVEAVEGANTRILERAADETQLRGMGTTFTGVGILQNTVVCAQVGDSRAYLFRGGRLLQLTRDQTMVQAMLDAGAISAEEARTSDQGNLILQALGSTPEVDVVLTYQELAEDDIVLLCTDGLSGVLDDGALAEALTRTTSPRGACELLVRRANEAGGPDNITALVGQVRWNGPVPTRDGPSA